jgi:hypothetical protein
MGKPAGKPKDGAVETTTALHKAGRPVTSDKMRDATFKRWRFSIQDAFVAGAADLIGGAR